MLYRYFCMVCRFLFYNVFSRTQKKRNSHDILKFRLSHANVSKINMTYMKFIFPLFFSLITSFCFSQPYQEMLNHESEWHLTSCYSGCVNDVYYTDGDTIFNGNTYKILNGYHYISRTFWLREDIQNKKIFLSTIDGNKRVEDLLYDFSLEVGDSIAINNPLSPFPDSPGYFTLDSIIARQLLDGSDYRFFYLSPNPTTSSTESPVWIEGIGSLSLINAPGGTPNVNASGKISCYFNDAELLYTQLDSIQSCKPIHVTGIEEETKNNLVKVYPTNCNDILFVSSFAEEIKSIEIFDMNGTKVFQENALNNHFNKLEISKLAKGLFIVKVSFSSGNRMFKVAKV